MAESIAPIIRAGVALARSGLLVGRSLEFTVELFVAIVTTNMPNRPSFMVCARARARILVAYELPLISRI